MPSRSPSRIVAVFAKPARPGHVKTRLRGELTAREAAEVHLACVHDTTTMLGAVRGCEKHLLVAGGSRAARELAAAVGLSRRWRFGVQVGRHLGGRLQFAFQSFFRRGARSRSPRRPGRGGARKVVIVGTDTPWMGAARILRAFKLLDQADVVLGPTVDGGYYLVGARKLIPAMFHGIPWGSSAVFRRTRSMLRHAHATCRLLPRDFDLDRPRDLAHAARLLQRGKIRAKALERWIRQRAGSRALPATGSSRRR